MRKWQAESQFLQWNSIKPLANSDVSRFIAIVPIVGYFILFSDGFAQALSFDLIAGHEGAGAAPFLISTITKLRLAFFGSLFVLAANLLFRLRSPSILTSSMSDLEFCEKVLGSYSASEIKEIEERVISHDWVLRTPLLLDHSSQSFRIKNEGVFPKISGYREKQHMVKEHSDYIRSLARELWAGEMHKNPGSRYTTLAFASLGFLMLSVSTLDILQAVVRDLLP